MDQLIANAHACAVLAFTVLALGPHLFPYSRNGEEPGLRQICSGFGHEELVTICWLMILGRGISAEVVLAAVMIFPGILTNFVSNNAAAAVGTPVALSVARQIGAPLEPFVLAAIVGCNLAFATPMGYQTNVLIMQPGGCVFRNFVRVGGPLVVLMIIAFSLELSTAYPM